MQALDDTPKGIGEENQDCTARHQHSSKPHIVNQDHGQRTDQLHAHSRQSRQNRYTAVGDQCGVIGKTVQPLAGVHSVDGRIVLI